MVVENLSFKGKFQGPEEFELLGQKFYLDGCSSFCFETTVIRLSSITALRLELDHRRDEITLVVCLQGVDPLFTPIGYVSNLLSKTLEPCEKRPFYEDIDTRQKLSNAFDKFNEGQFRSFAFEVMRRASNQRNTQDLGLAATHAL